VSEFYYIVIHLWGIVNAQAPLCRRNQTPSWGQNAPGNPRQPRWGNEEGPKLANRRGRLRPLLWKQPLS